MNDWYMQQHEKYQNNFAELKSKTKRVIVMIQFIEVLGNENKSERQNTDQQLPIDRGRWGVKEGMYLLQIHGHEEQFGSVTYTHYVKFGDGFIGMHICQNSWDCTLYSSSNWEKIC